MNESRLVKGRGLGKALVIAVVTLLALGAMAGTALAVPIVDGSKTDDLIVDIDGDGEADPGDAIQYTVVVINSGDMDAVGTVFSDTVDANTTLAPGSVRTTPIARHDYYGALGNVSMTVPAGSGVLANDEDPDGVGGLPGVTVQSFDLTSANGGTVSVAANGSFTYDPPPGFEGSDAFNYTVVDDEGQTDPASVFITVDDIVWFIDNSAGGSSNVGTFNDPFTSITSFNSAQGASAPNAKPGDVIFVYQGTGTYVDGIVLQNNQVLFGQGIDLLVQLAALAIVPPAHSDLSSSPAFPNRPTLTDASGNGITLAQGNLVRGLDVGNTSGNGITNSGGTVGSLTIDTLAINGTGGGISIANGGTLAVSLDNVDASSSTDEGIHLNGISGSFTVADGQISTTGVTGVRIDGDPSLALAVTLESVSTNGSDNGIDLTDTTGSFTVGTNAGGETVGAGGTIQNTTSNGVSLNNVTNITLRNMLIDATGRHGVDGSLVTNYAFVNGRIEDAGNANGENAMNFSQGSGVSLAGTVVISNTTLLRMAEHGVEIENFGGTLNMTVDNVIFRDNVNTICGSGGCEGDGMLVRADTAPATINLTVQDSTVDNIDNDGFDVGADPGGTVKFKVRRLNGINNSQGDNLIDIAASGGTTGDFEFDIKDFTSDGNHRGTVIFVKEDGTSTLDGMIGVETLVNNAISGSTLGRGIDIFIDGDLQADNPSARISVEKTNISNTSFEGIFAQLQDGQDDTANLHLTLVNNTVGAPTGGFSEGIYVLAGATTGDDGTVCLDMRGNTSTGAPFFDDARVRQRFSTIFQLEGFAGNGNLATDVESFIIGNNTPGISSVDVVIGDGFSSVANCTAPVVTPLALASSNVETGGASDASLSLTALPAAKTAGDQAADLDPVATNSVTLTGSPALQFVFAADTGLGEQEFETTAGTLALVPLDVSLDLGFLNAGQVVTVTFQVTVNTPLNPVFASQVCNQGLISGNNFGNVLTDDPATGTVDDPTCTLLDRGMLVIVKDAVPDDPVDFGFTSTIPGWASFVVSETVPLTITEIAPGSYQVTENVLPNGYSLKDIVCDDVASGAPSTGNTATATATANVEAGEKVVCTFTNHLVNLGDAPDPTYPTLLASNGASHVIVPGLYMGAAVDANPDGQPSGLAIGDDTDADGDDEDGVIFTSVPPVVTCELSSVTVTASAPGLLNAWLDFDGNGSWGGGSEQIFTDVALAAGPNALSFAVPCTATPTNLTFARFRFDSGGGLLPTGPAPDGEVEDYALEINGLDFGDAPDPLVATAGEYPTLLANDGARHVLSTGPHLGASVDDEPDGQPTAAADGDDTDTDGDDEDGVIFTSVIEAGQPATVDVVASGPGLLNAWLDVNADGDWADPGEQISTDTLLAVGLNPGLVFTVPVTSTIGASFARFRFDQGGGLSYDGLAPDGEVEDYSVTVLPPPAPDLQLDKDDGAVTAQPGDTVTYTLTFTNVGGQGATGVVITETVPATTTFSAVASTPGWACAPDNKEGSVCTLAIGPVAGGGGGSVDFAVVISNPVPAGVTQIGNTAEIDDDGANGADPTPGDNLDSDITPVDAAPDLQIDKDDGGVAVQPGETVTYTLTFANAGDQGATGVTITETVPANAIFNPVASASGWVCAPDYSAGSTCTLAVGALTGGGGGGAIDFAVDVDSPVPSGVTEISNTAEIDDDGANGADPVPGDNSDTESTPVDAAPDLQIDKDDGDATAQPGDTVTYTLTFTNAGGQGATGVTITETVPNHTTFNAAASTAGWVCVPDANAGSICTLAIGAVAGGGGGGAVDFAVDVADPFAVGVNQITNTAEIENDGANGADPNPGNNTDQDITTVDAAPDLQIDKDDGGVTANPGDTVSYTLTFTNAGNQNASSVIITDIVPANSTFNPAASTAGWVCTPDNSAGSTCMLAAGAISGGGGGGAVDYAIDVDDPLAAGVIQIDNTAEIGDDGTGGADANPGDNADDDSTPVDAVPDLQLDKDDGGVTALPGQTISYTLTYTNVGSQGASGVSITDTVPAHASFNPSASSPGWICAPDNSAGSACTLALGLVDGGGAGGSIQFAVDVDKPLPPGVTRIDNAATIGDDGANGADSNPGDNTATDNTPVVPTAELSLAKASSHDPVIAGASFVYSLTVYNGGPADANNVAIVDPLPSEVDWNSASPGCAESGGVVTCTVALLANGDSATFHITVTAQVTATGSLTNSAKVTATEPDQNPADNAAYETTRVVAGVCDYVQDFETSVGGEWSISSISTTPSGRSFLGEFSNGTVSLSLDDLPPHTQATLAFDLFAIRSWDGNEMAYAASQGPVVDPDGDTIIGPDIWSVALSGGDTLANTTFSNWGPETQRQSYPGDYPGGDFAARTGASELMSLGYDFHGIPMDAVYALGYRFDHNAESLTLDFVASGLQALADESWGLDNVQVCLDAGAVRVHRVYLPSVVR